MPARSGLGKGLDALIPGGSGAVGGSGAAQVPIDSIAHNPRQPRQSFKESELLELAASIREHGIIQPLIVAPAWPVEADDEGDAGLDDDPPHAASARVSPSTLTTPTNFLRFMCPCSLCRPRLGGSGPRDEIEDRGGT